MLVTPQARGTFLPKRHKRSGLDTTLAYTHACTISYLLIAQAARLQSHVTVPSYLAHTRPGPSAPHVAPPSAFHLKPATHLYNSTIRRSWTHLACLCSSCRTETFGVASLFQAPR